jgi:hypothetical protein
VRRRLGIVVAAVSAVALVVGCVGAWWTAAQPDPRSVPPVAPAGGTGPAARPTPPAAETAVAEAAASAVRDRLPRPVELVADEAGLRMPVRATGVAKDGQMALPDSNGRLGWYRYGPPPGSPRGSTVLAGHVDTAEEGVGPLVRLADLRRGGAVRVRLADGSVVRYRTRSVQRFPKAGLPLARLFDRDGPAVLRVITCGGEYDAEAGGYQENVVLTAVPYG